MLGPLRLEGPCHHSPWVHTMLRCVLPVAPRALFAALAVVAATLPGAAHAQPNPNPNRVFPATALRGEIAVGQPPALLLNGQPARLAPGARVRGPDNMLLLQAQLAGVRAVVHYTTDLTGSLLDVWVLTPAEVARRPWPTTPQQAAAWTFDPVAQRWSQP